ncbi:MAG: GNAT family N-acetyltransferase [Phycisphaerae bacterium]|jgi:GNAT superfamily N-acetyltransferase
MANAKIVAVGPGELELIADLYSQVFSPPQSAEYFQRRVDRRYNVGLFVALLDDRHVGFTVSYELRPVIYYCWLCGVLPDARRMGVATQLMQALEAFVLDHDYGIIRFECQNQHRPMLHLAITEGYDLVGMRWDTAISANVAIFEKDLR